MLLIPALILTACQGENTSSSHAVVTDYRTATPTHDFATSPVHTFAVLDEGLEGPSGLDRPTRQVPEVSAASEGTLAPLDTRTAEPDATPVAAVANADRPTDAAGDSGSEGTSSGAPWYVPAQWVDAWLACSTAPWRYDRTTWLATGPWPLAEAAYVADHEGGWDACQFNTAGSGACGWLQELPCEGLDPATQIAVARSKWASCGFSFECAWYHWW